MKKILTCIIIIVIAAALVYYLFYQSTGAENEFILPGTDENLSVNAIIDLTLNFADGTSKTITGTTGNPLSVEYNGAEVSSAEWRMKAQANTPSGAEPYDHVEINLNPTTAGFSESNFALNSKVLYNMGDNQWRTHWSESTSAALQVVDVPVDSSSPTVLYTHTVVFDNVFSVSDSSQYSYKLVFDPTGYCIYRGNEAGGGNPGEWQTVALGAQNMACEYPIDLINQDVTVSWDSQVVWN